MKNKLLTAIAGVAWNISLIVSFYAIAIPKTPIFISGLLALLLISFDFFTPSEIPFKQRRAFNIFTVILIPIVIFVSLVLNPYQFPYTAWHVPAVVVLAIELLARFYLIIYPARRLPMIFYVPRRK